MQLSDLGHAIPELGTAAIPISESDDSDSGRNNSDSRTESASVNCYFL